VQRPPATIRRRLQSKRYMTKRCASYARLTDRSRDGETSLRARCVCGGSGSSVAAAANSAIAWH